jgi:hypothetical protein
MTNTQLIFLALAVLAAAVALSLLLRPKRPDVSQLTPLPGNRATPPVTRDDPVIIPASDAEVEAEPAPAPEAEVQEIPEAAPLPTREDPGADDALNMQIALLAEAGLALAPGVTRWDLIDEAGSDAFAHEPFGPILFYYASEAGQGDTLRPMVQNAALFDMESIDAVGDYAAMTRKILRVAGLEDQLIRLEDTVDPHSDGGQLIYQIGPITRELTPLVDSDWLDMEVFMTVLHDVSTLLEGRRFWTFDNQDAFGLLALTEDGASLLNDLAPGILEPVHS